MKTHVLRTLLVVLGVIVVATTQGDRAQVAAKSAVLTFMYGDVQVRHGIQGWSEAKLNETLKPGDAVKTGADARAEITLGNGGYVRVDENSHLLITYLQEDGVTRFKALMGGVWVTLEKALGGNSRFEVEMPSAVASVKGTVFRCEVDEEGDSSTYVYDGEVDVAAGETTERVGAAHWLKVKGDRRMQLAKMDLAAEDIRDFVKHSRQRDILRHLGNPTIIVALSDGQEREKRAAFEASKSLADTLKRNGFAGASVTSADKARYTFKEDGLIEWLDQKRPDYFVLGRTRVDEIREISGGKHSARGTGSALVLPAGGKTPVVKVNARVRGEGRNMAEAASNAIRLLGMRLGRELVPSMIAELMQERQGTVRIEITGETNREQIQTLRDALHKAERISRVTVVPRPGGGLALAVAGDVDAGTIAGVLRQLPMVQGALAVGRVVHVRFAASQGQGPKAEILRRAIKNRGGKPAGGARRPFGRRPQQ